MRTIPSSELIIHPDGSIFHLHLKPEQLADKIILVGDPERVTAIAQLLTSIECNVQSREFHSVTGFFQNKRITVVSHGIGCDNIDIVLNELDALANINFETRQVNKLFRQLTLVRIGTSGGLQAEAAVGSYVAAKKSIGFDGVLYFYEDSERVRDLAMEQELIEQLDWKQKGIKPYVVASNTTLFDQITQNEMLEGYTIAANGFYGPQGRELRLPLLDPSLNKKIEAFSYENIKITNYEMESSALAGLSLLLGHKALTVCCIIAGRVTLNINTHYQTGIMGLVQKVLERI
jgi:uridine phosphorylase